MISWERWRPVLMFLLRLAMSHCPEGYRVRWNTIVSIRMKAMTTTSHQEIRSARSWRLTRRSRVSLFSAASLRFPFPQAGRG